jgi:outer membrane protein assembly factor BamB
LVRPLKLAGVVAVGLVGMAALIYAAGGRVELGGGGTPHLTFAPSADAAAEAISRHRAAQRAAAAIAATPSSVARAPASASTTDPAPPPFRSTDTTTYWTAFRGPQLDGRYSETTLRLPWPESLQPIWKEPVGGGYASMVVARGRLFTIEQRGRDEVAAAYDAATGRELWTSQWRAAFRESMGGDGPRATPAWSDGFVYVLGALGELRCLDEATGRVGWRKNILDDNDAANLQWGVAASPLVAGDLVVVMAGGGDGRSVVAYDRRTGARVWSALDDRASYVSPSVVTLAGVRHLLVLTATRLAGLSLDDGTLLWEFPWRTDGDINAAQPVVTGDRQVFVSSSYGTGAAGIEIVEDGGRLSARQVWRNTKMKNKFASSVLHEGYLYGLDESILACLDAATGEQKWKGGRYGYGQLLAAGGMLIVLTEDGDLALVRATPAGHEELRRFHALDVKTWNVPDLAGGRLFVRNLAEMAAFDLR